MARRLRQPPATLAQRAALAHTPTGAMILRMTIGDIADPDKVRAAKKALRIAVYYGRLTSLHVQLGVPYFYWFAKTSPDGGLPTPAFFANQLPDVKEAKDHVYSRIAPTLISLAMLHKARNDQKNLDAVVQLLGMCPPEAIPELVRQHLPPIQAK